LVVEIAKDAAPWRWKAARIVAVTGVAPSARNLSEMGIRGAPSSEPWIQSNIWLVRSFGLDSPSRPVWISSQIENASAVDYARTVADAAAGGGRWIVSFDDALRAKLRARDASALEAWRRLSRYLKFAESHAAWRALAPYGNVGIVLDPASTKQDLADEYLNLAARRQVPYRLVARSALNAAAVVNFRALVATELDPPSAAERKLLQDFAENGGLVMMSDPIDVDDLLADAGEPRGPWTGMPAGTLMGHIHLHVADLEASERFYVDVLGFDLMQHLRRSAAFVSAGGYHHHIAFNLWAGAGVPPPPPGSVGLRHYEVRFPDEAALEAVLARVRAAAVPVESQDGGAFVRDPSANALQLIVA
jgi:catechol 2,3-dioxygenase-like lactoylglutathione lyase family enzyme